MDYILQRYYKFAKLQGLNSKRLIKHTLQDYKIKFKLETILKFYLIYKLIKTENLALKEFIKENLKKGYIKPLQSSAGYLVLFILKKNKKLKIYINYRQLNSIIKKINTYYCCWNSHMWHQATTSEAKRRGLQPLFLAGL